MLLIVVATFCGLRTSAWHQELAVLGWPRWLRLHFLSFHGLDDLVHADTMLFILGLTLFVAVIAQTRLLEGVTYVLLRRYRGAIQPTVIAVTAAVAVASGILGGVSLISLTIRTLVIVLMLAAAPVSAIRYADHAVHRGDDDLRRLFGVRRAAEPDHEGQSRAEPGERFLSLLLRSGGAGRRTWSSRGSSAGASAASASTSTAMDVIDANVADVRFLQATRHGEVLTPIELIEGHAAALGDASDAAAGAGAPRRVDRDRAGPGRGARGRPGSSCSGTSSARIWPTRSIATTCSTRPATTRAPSARPGPSTRWSTISA